MKTTVASAVRGLFIAMLLAGTQAFAQALPKVGDWWAFDVVEHRNGKTFNYVSTRKIVGMDGDLFVIEITAVDGGVEKKFRETRDQNMNIVESGRLRYKPNLDLFQFPMVAGKRSFSVERIQTDNGRTLRMEGVVEVSPATKVKAADTEVEAYELVSNGRMIDPAAGTSNRYQTKVLFAPSVGFYVWQEYFDRNPQDTADGIKATYVLKGYQRQ